MRKRPRSRFGLMMVLVTFTFITFFIAAAIVALISVAAIEAGWISEMANKGMIVPILSVLLASLMIGTMVSFALGRLPLRPMAELIDATERISAGDFSVRLHMDRPPEMKALTESFNRMAKELGGVEVLRTDFINSFSHEFKTPIVSIKGFAELLKNNDLAAAERDEYLDIIIRESSRLAALSTNVLNLSKVENQEILSECHAFNVGEQVRRAVLELASQWERKNLSLIVDVQDVTYVGNEALLPHVWINLLSNAIRFSPDEGVITITLVENDATVEFRVRDGGIGITPEQMPHIYDKFYQGDASHTSVGNGLGLTVAQKIVRLHKGVITCTSAPGEGAEFIVRLPQAR